MIGPTFQPCIPTENFCHVDFASPHPNLMGTISLVSFDGFKRQLFPCLHMPFCTLILMIMIAADLIMGLLFVHYCKLQARERAWRIGQTRDVTIYRLITRGTIEEKVYHRQIYKHFLTNKILKNPQQRRFFKARDMKDLFTLNDDEKSGSSETSNIFSQLSEDINLVGAHIDDQNKPPLRELATFATSDRQNSSDTGNKVKQMDDHNDGEVDEETNILRSLFDAHGIHVSH